MNKGFREIYRELSCNFDKVQQLLGTITSPTERLLCAVLVDDMEALMEECESFLVDGSPDPEQQEAFGMRYEVVVDEISDVLRLHDSGVFNSPSR